MEAVTGANTQMTSYLSRSATALGVCALAVVLSACDLPFGLGLPSTRALESGVQDSLSKPAFEVSGTLNELGQVYTVDVQFERPDKEHITVTGSGLDVEAIVLGSQAYYRGQAFLASRLGTDPLSQNIVKAAGNAWWKGSAGLVPLLAELTEADAFKRTFLGSNIRTRTDHVMVGDTDTTDLSGPRADIYVSLASPYPLVRIKFLARVAVDGVAQADLKYKALGSDFAIAAPTDVIDFSNLSTLPPIYSVISVDTSKCTNPCVVSALLKNLGGLKGAKGPSIITFTMTATSNNAVIGSCNVQVVPDVGYNATTTATCSISITQTANAAIVTAIVNNPGRG